MKVLIFFVLFLLVSCSHAPKTDTTSSDPFIKLEDIRSPESMAWVKAENELSSQRLKANSGFATTKSNIKDILASKERIPTVSILGNFVYNHWTDEKNPRGLWRRAKLSELGKKSPRWEVLLDVDALGKAENESWVLKRVDIEESSKTRALIFLSRKGKDATVMREFDIPKKSFIKDGFNLPESKMTVAWLNIDALVLGTDFGPNTMTDSGYPRLAKLWKRAQPLAEARLLLESPAKNIGMWIWSTRDGEKSYTFIGDRISFYDGYTYLVTEQSDVRKMPIPLDSEIDGVFNGQMYYLAKTDLKTEGATFKSGTLLKLSISAVLANGDKSPQPELVFESTPNQVYSSIRFSKDKRWLTLLNQVNPNVFELTSDGKLKSVGLPSVGNTSLMATSDESDQILVTYANYNQPTTLYSYNNATLKKLKSLPSFYNATDIVVEQKWTNSKDGTRIPYYLVRHKKMPFNSSNPTLLYAYGGFEVPIVPNYSGVIGKAWLEAGGTYVLANIRGGGEFGPSWHQSALKLNRQRAFDDFFAVAEDLIKTKVTSPNHLGIMGGSNGGLLMGVALTQRPDLFKAVICEVPLLDMSRYHLLLAGASWVAEYGSPDIPKERDYLLGYSPYQNLKPSVKYPNIFITTSTEDDRVHPGHARKMAAKLKSFGKPYLYFENTEGGHGRTADLNQAAEYLSMQYTFLKENLF